MCFPQGAIVQNSQIIKLLGHILQNSVQKCRFLMFFVRDFQQSMIIYLLALDGMITTSLTLPLEMFNAAHTMSRAAHRRKRQSLQPELRVIGHTADPVTSTGGLQVLPTSGLADLPQGAVIFIPSFWRNPTHLHKQWPALTPWLRAQHARGAKLCATGTGVFLLADTGLLDNRPATTHWFYLDKLHSMFPLLQLQRRHLITQAGQLYCAGSVNSIADLAIHLIEQVYNHGIAVRVEQQFSPEIRRRYNELFYSFESSSSHPDETVVLVQQWLHENHASPINLADVAEEFSLSQRTLNRRFKEATGITPTGWLLRLRMETARDLLTSTNLEVGDIALRCGFQDPGYFNRVFRKHMETTPGQYRAQVRGKLFTP